MKLSGENCFRQHSLNHKYSLIKIKFRNKAKRRRESKEGNFQNKLIRTNTNISPRHTGLHQSRITDKPMQDKFGNKERVFIINGLNL